METAFVLHFYYPYIINALEKSIILGDSKTLLVIEIDGHIFTAISHVVQ